MNVFDETVIAGVTGHMNGDHAEDNLLIARAFGFPDAEASEMVGLDSGAGTWRVTDRSGSHELRLPWPGGQISARPDIRREVAQLYRDACHRLGLPARPESEPAARDLSAQQAAPEGHDSHGAQGAQGAHGALVGGTPAHGADADGEGAEEVGFSRRIREASWSDHSDSEGAGFMADIMRGRSTREDYTALVVQHFFMYEALEPAVEQLLAGEEFSGFLDPALPRRAALERDLALLLGDDWAQTIEPLPATAAYAARIREVAEQGWSAGLVAHHYTRYLGDLSGGQMIARRVSGQFGFDGAGVGFYDFTELGSIPAFKARYRAALDALGRRLDEAEIERTIDEVRTAYRCNTEVFVDLGLAKARAAERV